MNDFITAAAAISGRQDLDSKIAPQSFQLSFEINDELVWVEFRQSGNTFVGEFLNIFRGAAFETKFEAKDHGAGSPSDEKLIQAAEKHFNYFNVFRSAGAEALFTQNFCPLRKRALRRHRPNFDYVKYFLSEGNFDLKSYGARANASWYRLYAQCLRGPEEYRRATALSSYSAKSA